LAGGADKIKESGGVLLGGHTIETPEMYFGLSVTGKIHPKKIYQNNTGKIGDLLILTKPIGMGILTTAIKADMLSIDEVLHTSQILKTLNKKASILMRKYRVSSCTDITGFGLLGHALECSNFDTTLKIYSNEVPVVDFVKPQLEMGVIPAGTYRNRDYLEDKVHYEKTVDLDTQVLLNDAQTSGGLLIAINKDDCKEFLKEIEEVSFGYGKIIGEIIPRKNHGVIVQ
ncbi:MAG: selenide, water dikinase SelD, partial [Campylobacterales bacterium]|nr:selenide, water dikinase SelD [Campylobacterales bacterium]